MAKGVRHRNPGPALHLLPERGACARCGQPRDLRPDQQAAVVRSLARRYATLLGTTEPSALVRAPFGPGSWSALEHAGYIGAMLGMAYIRLHQLLTEQGIEPMPAPVSSPCLVPGESQVQQVTARISSSAEHLARTIAWGTRTEWQVVFRADGALFDVIHRAIDETTEHLQQAQAAVSQPLPMSPRRSGACAARVRSQEAPASSAIDFAGTVSIVADTAIVSLRGELDIASRPELRRVLDEIAEAGRSEVVIDLREVTFADGSGVNELARAWRRADLEGRRLTLRAPSPTVRRVLGLSRVDRLMVIEEADAAPPGPQTAASPCNRSGQPVTI